MTRPLCSCETYTTTKESPSMTTHTTAEAPSLSWGVVECVTCGRTDLYT